MKYKFEQFNLEIDSPTVEVVSIVDYIGKKECDVNVLLTTPTATFGVLLKGFVYTNKWDDSIVIAWANNELKKYETKTK